MSFQRVHQFTTQNPQTSWSSSQFAPRPFPAQEPYPPLTQEEIENQAFEQDKFEATGLQLKEKYGTITPIEQEKLGMLQAKMDSFWAQRMERAQAQPNLLEILIRNTQATPTTESTVSVQPKLSIGQPSRATSTTAPALAVQPKLTIGEPKDQYEEEANRVAKQVMSMTPPATPNVQRQTEEEEQAELQTKPLAEMIVPLSVEEFQAETLQRFVEYSQERPVRAVENFTVPASQSNFERQIIAWIGNLVERERAAHLVRSSVTFSELRSRLQPGSSVEITAELIWNQSQVVEVRFSIPTFDYGVDEGERVEGVPWRHLRDSHTREIVRQLHGSFREIERNTAQRIIDNDVTVMYSDELTPVGNEAEVLERAGLDPANYRLYWHPDPQSSGQPYFHLARNAVAARIPSTSIIVIDRYAPVDADLLSTVVHETNHAVNRLFDADRYDPNTQFQEYMFAKFRTEFRAYWVSDRVAQTITNLDERARRIRDYILAEYGEIREAYDSDEVLRRRIDAHTRPDGNLTNE